MTISLRIYLTEGWISYPVSSFNLYILFYFKSHSNGYFTQFFSSPRFIGIMKHEISIDTINYDTSSLPYSIPFSKYYIPSIASLRTNLPLHKMKLLNTYKCLSRDEPFSFLNLSIMLWNITLLSLQFLQNTTNKQLLAKSKFSLEQLTRNSA